MLGTVLELRLTGDAAATAAAELLFLTEFERLERVFSAYDQTSTLSRWRTGRIETTVDTELGHLLIEALRWQEVSNGSFNTASGVLSDLWKAAERAQVPPDPEELTDAVRGIAEPCYVVDGAEIRRTADCSSLNLNAFAKGHIVDSASRIVAGAIPLESMIINAGGDLLHWGEGAHVVGIENPHRPYDNEPPISSISISNQAVATSGTARRGFRIAGKRYGHIVSPLTGEPASEVFSASVIADDAATADVVATIVAVLGVDAGLAFVATLPDVGCLLVDRNGATFCNDQWSDQRLP